MVARRILREESVSKLPKSECDTKAILGLILKR
jgi:hypothetical protein